MAAASIDPLQLRPLGSTGLRVTGLCVGAAPLGDMTGVFASEPGRERAVATVQAALAGPIRFLDTAPSYGDGTSEERVGLALREAGGTPADFLVATKADPDATTRDFSGEQVRRSVARSQRLLGIDRLPLVYLHDPEYHDDAELMGPGGAVETLVRLRAEGVIGAIGLAGGDIVTIRRYLELGVFSVMLTHNRFNLLNRAASGLIDEAVRGGVAVVNAAPYGGGILSLGPDRFPRFMYRVAEPGTVANAQAYQRLADRHGVPLPAVALQFSLRDARLASTVVGMGRPERIAETVQLATMPIPADLWTELGELPFAETEGV